MPRLPLRSSPFLLVVLLAACERARPVYVPKAATHSDLSPIWIGECGPWSGRRAREGWAEHRGFQLAIEAANAGGGVRGRPLRVHGYDDQSNAKYARTAGERLTKQDKAVLIVGHGSSPALGAGDVPVISPEEVLPATGEDAPEVVSIEPILDRRMSALADHLRAAGFERVTVLVRPHVVHDGAIVWKFTSAASNSGLGHVEQRELTLDDLGATIAYLQSDAKRAILVACDGADAAMVCSVLKRRGVESAMFAAGAPDIESLPADQRVALEGVVAPSVFDADAASGPAAELVALHAARFDGEPDEREYLGWMAGRLAVAALTKAREYWPADVRAALRESAAPPLKFVMVRVEHGALHTVTTSKAP